MTERAMLIGPDKALVGVYTEPGGERTEGSPALVMLNAGLIHHVGPQRLHVNLARSLAAEGLCSLRVDCSGIGDSPVRRDDTPADRILERDLSDVFQALGDLGHERFILFGICSGAKAALQAIPFDQRICGVILVNQAASNPVSAELADRISSEYYLKRSLWNPRAWIKLLTGRVDYRTLIRSLGTKALRRRGKAKGDGAPATSPLVELFGKELRSASEHGVRTLVVLSDRGAQFAKMHEPDLDEIRSDGLIDFALYPEADHLFMTLRMQQALIRHVCDWAGGFGHDLHRRRA